MSTNSISAGTTRPRIRHTRQRQLVNNKLAESSEFRTAQQVFAELRDAGETIGLATVYRTLQALADAGEADAIRTADGETAYRRCSPAHHHHLICRNCGRTVEVAGEAMESWTSKISSENGFRDPEHILEIYATCQSCWDSALH